MSKFGRRVFILCCCNIFFTSSAFAFNSMVQDMDPDTILERIKPLVQVHVGVATADEAVVSGPAAPESIYKSYCTICHQAGIADAPIFRDAASWGDRPAVGIDALVKSAVTGKGAMPPKGTCMQCSDDELKAVIEYMLPR